MNSGPRLAIAVLWENNLPSDLKKERRNPDRREGRACRADAPAVAKAPWQGVGR